MPSRPRASLSSQALLRRRGACLASAQVLRGVDLEVQCWRVQSRSSVGAGAGSRRSCSAPPVCSAPESGELALVRRSLALTADPSRATTAPSLSFCGTSSAMIRTSCTAHSISCAPSQANCALIAWIDERCGSGDAVIVAVPRRALRARTRRRACLTLDGRGAACESPDATRASPSYARP